MKYRYHPEGDFYVTFQKMEIGCCQECLDNWEACTDPCTYCKYRSSSMGAAQKEREEVSSGKRGRDLYNNYKQKRNLSLAGFLQNGITRHAGAPDQINKD